MFFDDNAVFPCDQAVSVKRVKERWFLGKAHYRSSYYIDDTIKDLQKEEICCARLLYIYFQMLDRATVHLTTITVQIFTPYSILNI